MNLRLFFLLLLSFTAMFTFAQDKDEQLAAHYMGSNDYEKAADVYERLLLKNPSSAYFYDNLLTCYFKLNKADNAEKLVKKQIRRFEGNPHYQVDLGYVHKNFKSADKSRKQFEDVLEKMRGNESSITETANAFSKRGETDFAISAYLKGRRLNGNNSQLFCIPLAQLYSEKKDIRLMIDEYLNALVANPMLEEDVQGYLQLYLRNDAEYEMVKLALLKKNKDFPGNDAFSEMLIWMYVQRRDFDNAFVQTKALDKRYKEDGHRLIDLGYLAISNEKYDAAANIFSHVASQGKERPLYANARIGILDARSRKVLAGTAFTEVDLKLIEKEYLDFLNEFGRNYFSAPVLRDLARLQAYHLNDYASAIANFQELIVMQRVESKFRAECKLELGDIYVLKGEEWDAMLLYGQVDKDYIEDPLGQEAKFRNARLSYYLGEFEWARAQLDILKTATTQLIANNAIELSLLIQDNTVDSNEEPLEMFARADLNYFQNRNDVAIRILDSINLVYPRHSLDDDILFKRAQIAFRKRDYSATAAFLNQLLKENGSDILGDNALFMLADMTERNINDKAGALKLYEEFIEKFPGSFFLTEARKRYRALRGDQLN